MDRIILHIDMNSYFASVEEVRTVSVSNLVHNFRQLSLLPEERRRLRLL